MKWREITTVEEWNQTLENSAERPVLLLKHSTRCEVSANAIKEYESYLGETPREDIDYVLVKVIESRPVSNKIAEDLNVAHASPQMIWVKNKYPEWNASHWAITSEHMNAVLS